MPGDSAVGSATGEQHKTNIGDEKRMTQTLDGDDRISEGNAVAATPKRIIDPNTPKATPSAGIRTHSLREFLQIMDEFAPIIPDAVTDYYLHAAGFESDDLRVKRLLALAAQKFVADIAQDAYQISKVRATNPSAATAGGAPAIPRGRYGKDRARTVLTLDDLAASVHDLGISLRRQEFLR
ncbi:hypothetical protein PYCC9005_006052 [Savitreella phatthalungensis]